MAESITENYLLERFNKAIEETKAEKKTLLTKVFNLQNEFTELKEILNKEGKGLKCLEESKRTEKLQYLNNLVNEWQILLKGQTHDLIEAIHAAYRLNEKLKKMKKQLKTGEGSIELASGTQRSADSNQNGAKSSPNSPETYRPRSSRYPPKVHGLEEKVMFLERLLIRKVNPDGFNTVGLVGMAGIGKTTLAQVIFNNLNVKGHFLPRIWICLSKQPKEDKDYRVEIVKSILFCLGVEDDIVDQTCKKSNFINQNQAQNQGNQDPNQVEAPESSESQMNQVIDSSEQLRRLVCLLRLQLRSKRYLIVLDDAWNKDKFFANLSSTSVENEKCLEQLSFGLPKGHGGTVLVTTRSRDLAEKMIGEENLHRIEPLDDRESLWGIFLDTVQKDGIKFPEELGEMKDTILSKCDGLPLAAKMMGQIMHQQLQDINRPRSQLQEARRAQGTTQPAVQESQDPGSSRP